MHPHTWILVALTLSLVSCSRDREPTCAVRGEVLYRGQPAAGAVVIFHPEDGPERTKQLRPHATAAADGSFVLTTYVSRDGAPAGNYGVSIVWPGEDPGHPVDPRDPKSVPSGPDRLKGRYENPAASGLRATVTSGNNRPITLRLE